MDSMRELYELLGKTYAETERYKATADLWFHEHQKLKKENEELKADLNNAEKITHDLKALVEDLKKEVKINEQESEDAGDQR